MEYWNSGKIAATLCLVILSSCSTYEPVRRAQSADRDFHLAEGEGAVIIGVEINDDFLSHRDVRTMEFWEVDFEKRLWLHPEDGGKAVRLTRGNWLSGRDEYSGLELILQSFPAGDYALAQVVWGDHGVSAMENQAIAFTVRPGEITYVGDVSFDTPMTILQDVEVRVIARNDALAEKLRAKYPNLRGNVRHQDLRVLHMNCNASGFWSNPLRECSFPPKAAS